jgi:hypothetical protein
MGSVKKKDKHMREREKIIFRTHKKYLIDNKLNYLILFYLEL